MGVDENRWRIFDEINQERVRQDQKYGVCDHPMVPDAGGSGSFRGLLACASLGIHDEELARKLSQQCFADGRGTFSHIVKEEFSEFVEACAVEGETSNHAREEAVQIAAVWVAMIEAIDRKRAQKGGA